MKCILQTSHEIVKYQIGDIIKHPNKYCASMLIIGYKNKNKFVSYNIIILYGNCTSWQGSYPVKEVDNNHELIDQVDPEFIKLFYS